MIKFAEVESFCLRKFFLDMKVGKINKMVVKEKDKSITTRGMLIAIEKVKNIERALDQFSDQEKEDIKKIFFKGHSQIYAEVNDGISKDMYYHLKDKMIYLTAIEYGQVQPKKFTKQNL